MGCWHGNHGCGPWHAPVYGRGWYDPVDWFEEDWPVRRSSRSRRRADREAAGGALEARIDELREEVRRLEVELADLREAGEPAT